MTTRQNPEIDTGDLARQLWLSVGLLRRRLRQLRTDSDSGLKLQEASALAWIRAGGPTTASALARIEQITPQSMGTTVNSLEAKGLVERSADPEDGRLSVISITEAGLKVLQSQQGSAIDQLAEALSSTFSNGELKLLAKAAPLIERLAHGATPRRTGGIQMGVQRDSSPETVQSPEHLLTSTAWDKTGRH